MNHSRWPNNYRDVKTGQDLLDLGVVPRTSSAQIALITRQRLEALRDQLQQKVLPAELGRWQPLVDLQQQLATETNDPALVAREARSGMRVAGAGTEEPALEGVRGTIRVVEDDRLGVEWDVELPWWEELGDGVECEEGRGRFVGQDQVMLQAAEGIVVSQSYSLRPGVMADARDGHRVRLRMDHVGAGESQPVVPAGTVGTLVEHLPEQQQLKLRLDPAGGEPQALQLSLEQASGCLEVSSLGQLLPRDREQLVLERALDAFFPTTVLAPGAARRIVLALLMGKDLILYGPPGGGKSSVASDLLTLAQQGLRVIFVERDCQVQCNPFSIFDEQYAQVLDACPECKLKYDARYNRSGRFRRPAAAEVQVRVVQLGDGHGLEYVEGTVGLGRMHLAGYKIPRLDGQQQRGSSDFDPQGFHAGILPRTNNGLLHLDEMEKLRPQTRDCLLDALNSDRIKPDQLRYSYPAHGLIIGTTNDPGKFSGALNDRMAMLAVGYPEEVDTAHRITLRGYHHQSGHADQVETADPHLEQPSELRRLPMAVTLELAVESLYLAYRGEAGHRDTARIAGSNRSKFDALDAARAALQLDRLFFAGTPQVVQTGQLREGLEFALGSRIQGLDATADREATEQLERWVDQHLDELLATEEDTFWCRIYRRVAMAATTAPEVVAAFKEELAAYEADPGAALASHQLFVAGEDQPGCCLQYPLMDLLFELQPGMAQLEPSQLGQLICQLLEGRQRSTCICSG